MMESIDVEALLAKAGEHIFQGDLQGARLILEGSIQKESSDPRLKSLLAHVYSQLDMHIEALHIYDQLIRQFPKEGSLHFRKGLELLHIGDVPQGISLLQKACRLNPSEKDWEDFLHYVRSLMGFEPPLSHRTDFPPEWLKVASKLAKAAKTSSGPDQPASSVRYIPEESVLPQPQDGWLGVALKRGYYVRSDAIHMSIGEVRFLPVNGDGEPSGEDSVDSFLRCMGEGRILLSPPEGRRLFTVSLYEARLVVSARYLLAWPADISWEPGSLHSSGKEMKLHSFRGSGSIYLAAPASGLMEVKLSESDRTVIVPHTRMVAWHGHLLAQYREDSLLHISGSGTVLIER